MVPAAEEVVMILTISAGRENIYSSLFSPLFSHPEANMPGNYRWRYY
jgi:hypothetical protein